MGTVWVQYLKDKSTEELKKIVGPIDDPVAAKRAVVDAFLRTDEPMGLYRALNNGFFWHQGQYELTMYVEVDRPAKTFSKNWSFALAEEDCTLLRYNIITAIEAQTNETQIRFNFAYPSYVEAR